MSAEAFLAHFATVPRAVRRVDSIAFPESGCWLFPWKGYAKLGPKGARRYVHRMSLELKLGRPLRADEYALHSCDTPPCCNPAHLRPGTQRENLQDAFDRGRGNRACGLEHPNATVTDDEIVVALDRVARGETVRAVAASCGVDWHTVRRWRDGLTRRTAYDRWREAAA